MTDKRIVTVAGGSGFVGRYVVRALLARGEQVRVIARDRAKAVRALPRGVTIVSGDVLDAGALDEALRGAGACVNLVGILRESRGQGTASTFDRAHVQTPRMIVERCKALGVGRLVHVSALNVRSTGVSEYQRTKWAGEQVVRRSGLEWTIIRPGLVHGRESEFIHLAKGWVSGQKPPFLFLPYFVREVEDKRVPLGSVRREDPLVAPVSVEDVARAVAECLARPGTGGEVYNVVGSETLTWPQMLCHLRDTLPGANGELEPHGVPSVPAAWGARVAGMMGLGGWVPFDEGMARMGCEDSVASLDKVREDLGFTPAGFRESLSAYVPGH